MRRRVLAHSWTSAIRCGPDSDRPSTEALRRVSGLRSDLGADDFGQAQRAGARVVAVGEHQVEFAPALAALAQRQLFEYAAREVAAHPFLRIPGETQAHTGGVDRGGLVAHRPALLRAEPTAAAALAAGIANNQMAVPAQILQGQLGPGGTGQSV